MAEKVVLDAAVRKYAEAKKQIAALKVAIKQADKENAEILKGMKEEKTRETMAVHVRKIAKEEQKLVVSLVSEDPKTTANPRTIQRSTSNSGSSTIRNREGGPSTEKAKPKRQYTKANHNNQQSPPSYEEAVGEKQAVIAMARERTLEEDLLIAAIPAVFAASEFFWLSLCRTFDY
ncbi:hypothetical protein BDW59DRAFT_167292 [Aspergillus cavernicola]|uniref:Uncharacterized protein n=1 Tax=Aspergillus cavernicola TaxID=176166 RepID=A0ABR4HF31_9EURO